jgi:predicted nucleic acid-binding protein
METLFADASFFIAYHNSKDVNHQVARALIRGFEGHPVLLVTTDYIFDEVMTVLLVRGNKEIAIQAGKAMLEDSNIEILRIDEEIFNEAWKIFQGFKDKEWSFTDCTSYVLMKKLNIEAGISFDRHFKQFGLRVIP